MTNTISQLWKGDIEPVRYLGLNNFNVKRNENLMRNYGERIEKILDEDEKKTFEKYIQYVNEYISAITEQAFCDGFCMGAKITSEALNGVEKIL